MNAEIAAYDESIRRRLEAAVACLDGLTEAQINWRPTLDEGNSLYGATAQRSSRQAARMRTASATISKA